MKLRSMIVLFGTIVLAQAAVANPEGGVVSSGSATITQAPGNTVIHQASDKAIINWNSFNIGANEKTQFIQPSSSSIALNKINPNQGASQIFGSLSSNGQIILINQAGIFFGSGAQVNVAGIIASTTGMSDANFLAGKYIFDQTSSYNGTIINQGTIVAANNGLVALLGSNVANDGSIQANLGNVILASGKTFTVDLTGDGLINFTVDSAATAAGVDQDGQVMRDGVSNSGSVFADGGKILMTAKVASGVVDNIINMRGVAQANSVSNRNGVIILSGDSAGKVKVSGKLIASGKSSHQKGGTVKVLGSDIYLQSPASIDVSGDFGGGTILIGGNFHGVGPEQNAVTTWVESGVKLNADAITQGDGGHIAVWSDYATRFFGNITARGGAVSGNGGTVETSGGYLNVAGAKVNLLAAHGTTGSWLLDPTDVTISDDPTSNENYSGGTYTPSTDTSNILASELLDNLAMSNVTIETSSGGAGNGDISVNVPLTWLAATSLTLNAEGNIYLNGDISAVNGSLNLSAFSGGLSIVSGTSASPNFEGVTANIDVKNFHLGFGEWYQFTVGALPTFNVSGDFSLATDTPIYNGQFNGRFVRSVQGVSVKDPGKVTDIFGLQGIATQGTSINIGNDIDASVTQYWNGGAGFVPIGNAANPYIDTFNGQNYVISNLVINLPGQDYVGLFGSVGSAALIQQVVLQNVNIIGGTSVNGNVGAVIGYNGGATIDQLSASGSVQSTSDGVMNVGGLIGFNDGGNVNASSSSVNVTVANNASSVGGVVGLSFDGAINTTNNTGNVTTGTGATGVGGVVGNMTDSSLTNAYNTGIVTVGSGSTSVGGLAGILNSSIMGTTLNVYNIGAVIAGANSTKVGGLIGWNRGFDVSYAYSTGSVTAGANSESVGGLIGLYSLGTRATGNVGTAYSTGAVSAGAGSTDVAGLIGTDSLLPGIGGVSNVYSTGTVTGGAGTGLVGSNTGDAFVNAYWNTQTSGQASSADGVGMTTAQLQHDLASLGFSGADWDNITDTSYPYLLIFNPSTPRVISGYVPNGSPSASGFAGNTISLATAGSVLDAVHVGSNGYYYFLEADGAISDNSLFILYTHTGGNTANQVAMTPGSGGSITGLNLAANTIAIDGSVNSISNTSLLQIVGSLTDSNILYSGTGSDLLLGNASSPTVQLQTTSATNYLIDGNIATFGGTASSLDFGGDAGVFASTINTTGSQIYRSSLVLSSDVTLTADVMNAGDGITITNLIGNSYQLNLVGSNSVLSTLQIDTGNPTQTWNITSRNAGTVTDIPDASIAFSQFGNLTGGSADDTFLFSDAASVSGTVNGGSGNDTLNYAAYTTYVTPAFTSSVSGSVTNQSSQVITLFNNIGTLVLSPVPPPVPPSPPPTPSVTPQQKSSITNVVAQDFYISSSPSSTGSTGSSSSSASASVQASVTPGAVSYVSQSVTVIEQQQIQVDEEQWKSLKVGCM